MAQVFPCHRDILMGNNTQDFTTFRSFYDHKESVFFYIMGIISQIDPFLNEESRCEFLLWRVRLLVQSPDIPWCRNTP